MARFRLSAPARADIREILATSARRWGTQGRRRYAAALATAMRAVAADPEGRMTRSRNDLTPGIRSFHLRHLRTRTREAKVGSPVHLIYYRVVRSDLIEIVRVLHERMDPIRHLCP
jgi:toxin ParE1/3/4